MQLIPCYFLVYSPCKLQIVVKMQRTFTQRNTHSACLLSQQYNELFYCDVLLLHSCVFYYSWLRSTSSKWHAQAMCPCLEIGEAWGGVDYGIGPYSLNTRNNEVW